MRRRAFIAGLGAGLACPELAKAQITSRSQQAKWWKLGILDSAPRELNRPNLEIFYKRLAEFGYVEGRNLTTEYRSPEGRNELLPSLVQELLKSGVDLIVVRGTPEVLAVREATSTIPIVMSAVVDPVGLGVAKSLARPGGNVTGMSSVVTDLEAKRIQHLKEIVPGMKRMAHLGDFRNPAVRNQWEEVRTATHAIGVEARMFDIRSPADIRRAFEVAITDNVHGLRVGVDGTTRPNRHLIVALSLEHKLQRSLLRVSSSMMVACSLSRLITAISIGALQVS